jgi:hypothetical protein
VTSSIIIIAYGIAMYKIRFHGVVLISYQMEEDHTVTSVEEINLQDLRPNTQQPIRPTNATAQQNTPETVNINYLEADLFRMFYAIILIFIVCYFPYQVFIILEYFGILSWRWRYFNVVRKYAFVLTCFPSALHPLCYGLMTKFYAKAFSKLILCK